ncbi:MAG: PAS domain-containing protein [Burkholderiaceae bacterium]
MTPFVASTASMPPENNKRPPAPSHADNGGGSTHGLRRGQQGRGKVAALALVAIGLLLLLTTGLLLNQREVSLDRAQAQALREVQRMAAELDQSLRLAHAAIEQIDSSAGPDRDLPAPQRQLVEALNLPFELSIVATSPVDPMAVAGEWLPELPRQTDDHWHLPLTWTQPSSAGGRTFEMRLSRDALLARFSSNEMPAGSTMTLMRLEEDGATTILARHPDLNGAGGHSYHGPLAARLEQQAGGVFQTISPVDGIHRIVGYQRLSAPARRLAIVYAMGTRGVLDPWVAMLPWAGLMTLLVGGAMAYGARRLDRSIQDLARSELRFRLAAAHGQVWEWDFAHGGFKPNVGLFVQLGYVLGPSDAPDQVFARVVHPQDLPRMRAQIKRYLKGEDDFRIEFRATDIHGQLHWFDAHGSGVRNGQGRVTYMAGTAFDITDRKRLEEAQRQTLNQLETVANASAALFWTTDDQGRTNWVNRRWLEFTGGDDILTSPTSRLDDLHPLDQERCVQVFDAAFRARRPYTLEYRLRHRDGEYLWVLESGQPRHDADQRFVGYIGSCLDVTELRKAEATARERNALLEQVFDALQDMLFVLDEDERFVFYLAGRGDKLYRPPQDFLGKLAGDVMPPDLVAQLRQAMDQARHNGMQEVDYSLDLPIGTHHFNARLAWLPGTGHCMFVVRDTTERHRIEGERERLNRFVRLLLSLASQFINLPAHEMDQAIDQALHDLGSFVGADRTYLFEYDFDTRTCSNTHEWCAEGIAPERDSLQNLSLDFAPDWVCAHEQGEMFQVPDVQALPEGALKTLLQGQGIRSLMTIPLMTPEGCLGYVGLDSVRRPHAYGEEETTLLGLFSKMLVSTRLRVMAQNRIQELTGQLEQKVAVRTAQLESSVKRLQASNRELESFTYSASHDLRTPLRSIEGFSAMLLQDHADQLDDQGKSYLGRIQRATLHMAQLITDLLAYARLEQITRQVEPVVLANLVQPVVASFQDSVNDRQGQIETDLPASLSVAADPEGLSMVLRNLIDNALKFTPADRPPHIRITARREDRAIHMQVSDNGMGFDMKYHDQIFGMFQRLHRQDQIAGTGIGLAMVHKAVERMGGQIRADSSPGQGAVFHVMLPAA